MDVRIPQRRQGLLAFLVHTLRDKKSLAETRDRYDALEDVVSDGAHLLALYEELSGEKIDCKPPVTRSERLECLSKVIDAATAKNASCTTVKATQLLEGSVAYTIQFVWSLAERFYFEKKGFSADFDATKRSVREAVLSKVSRAPFNLTVDDMQDSFTDGRVLYALLGDSGSWDEVVAMKPEARIKEALSKLTKQFDTPVQMLDGDHVSSGKVDEKMLILFLVAVLSGANASSASGERSLASSGKKKPTKEEIVIDTLKKAIRELTIKNNSLLKEKKAKEDTVSRHEKSIERIKTEKEALAKQLQQSRTDLFTAKRKAAAAQEVASRAQRKLQSSGIAVADSESSDDSHEYDYGTDSDLSDSDDSEEAVANAIKGGGAKKAASESSDDEPLPPPTTPRPKAAALAVPQPKFVIGSQPSDRRLETMLSDITSARQSTNNRVLNDALEKAEQNIVKLREERQEEANQRIALEAELGELRTQLIEIGQAAEQRSKEMSIAKRALEEARNAAKEEKRAADEARVAVMELEENPEVVATLRSEIGLLRQTIDKKDRERIELNQELQKTDFRTAFENERLRVQARDRELAELRTRVEEMRQTMVEVEQKRKKENRRGSIAISADIMEMKRQLEEARATIADLSKGSRRKNKTPRGNNNANAAGGTWVEAKTPPVESKTVVVRAAGVRTSPLLDFVRMLQAERLSVKMLAAQLASTIRRVQDDGARAALTNDMELDAVECALVQEQHLPAVFSGPGLCGMLAGSNLRFVVRLIEQRSGSVHYRGGHRIEAQLIPDAELARHDERARVVLAKVKDNGDGSYSVSATTKVAGQYRVRVFDTTDSVHRELTISGEFNAMVLPKAEPIVQLGDLPCVDRECSFKIVTDVRDGDYSFCVRVSWRADSLLADVRRAEEGVYVVTYTPVVAGVHDVIVLYRRHRQKDKDKLLSPRKRKAQAPTAQADPNDDKLVALARGTLAVRVLPRTEPEVSGAGLETSTVGEQAVFLVKTARATQKVSVHFASFHDRRPVSDVRVVDEGEGSYRVQYTPMDEGQYHIYVRVNGRLSNGSRPYIMCALPRQHSKDAAEEGFALPITLPQTNPDGSLLSPRTKSESAGAVSVLPSGVYVGGSGISQCTAGGEASFEIRTFSSKSKRAPLFTGGARIVCHLERQLTEADAQAMGGWDNAPGAYVQAVVRDNRDGSYLVRYSIPADGPGQYHLYIDIDGTPYAPMPFTVFVQPPRGVELLPVSSALVARKMVDIRVTAPCALGDGGNDEALPAARFYVDVSGPKSDSPTAELVDFGDGTFGVRFEPRNAGYYRIRLEDAGQVASGAKSEAAGADGVESKRQVQYYNCVGVYIHSLRTPMVYGSGARRAFVERRCEFRWRVRGASADVAPSQDPNEGVKNNTVLDVVVVGPSGAAKPPLMQVGGEESFKAQVRDLGNNTYLCSWVPRRAGAHRITVIQHTPNDRENEPNAGGDDVAREEEREGRGDDVALSPRATIGAQKALVENTVKVTMHVQAFERTDADVEGPMVGTSGRELRYTLHTHNTHGGAAVRAWLLGTQAVCFVVRDVGGGAYALKARPSLPGTYRLRIRVGEKDMLSCTRTILVGAQAPHTDIPSAHYFDAILADARAVRVLKRAIRADVAQDKAALDEDRDAVRLLAALMNATMKRVRAEGLKKALQDDKELTRAETEWGKRRALAGRSVVPPPDVARHRRLALAFKAELRVKWAEREEDALRLKRRLNAAKKQLQAVGLAFTAPTNVVVHSSIAPLASTALHDATLCGDKKRVVRLLEEGAAPNEHNALLQTPLHMAALSGAVDAVVAIVEAGGDATSRTRMAETPLHYAARSVGPTASMCVTSLLGAGAYVDDPDVHGCTALHYACKSGKMPDVVRTLLDAGAACTRNFAGELPLHAALRNCSTGIARNVLAQCGDDVLDATNDVGRTPLFEAANVGAHLIVLAMVERGADAAKPTRHGWTPLHAAAEQGHMDTVKVLVDRSGVAINVQTQQDAMTPLCLACMRGHESIVKFLLERRANINFSRAGGMRPLHAAIAHKHYRIAAILLASGAHLNPRCDALKSSTPLMVLVAHRELPNMELFAYMLRNGAQLNVRDVSGNTALHLAAQNGHVDCVTALIKAKADVQARNAKQRTPLDLATHKSVIKVLRKAMGTEGEEEGEVVVSLKPSKKDKKKK